MLTGDKFVNIVQKRLMGFGSFKNYFLDYLKDSSTALMARVYNKDGTFHASVKVAITAGGANDQISLTTSPSPVGTDGSGHLITWSTADDAYFKNVDFENGEAAYDVGVHYAERPSGVQANPRTGKPEYQRYEETWGVADDPVSVTDQGGGVFRFRLPTSMCAADKKHTGRKCLVWMKVPADAALTEAIAVLELTVAFGTYNYVDVDTGTYDLGQTTFSTDEIKYSLLLLGPTIAQVADLDIEAAAGFWYIGEVTGNGPGATPTVFDVTDQRLITKSLSDWLENLVYDNVVNTFTKKQIIISDSGVGLDSTGFGLEAGVLGKGGATDGGGVVGQGGGTNGFGMSGEGKGTGVGLTCSNVGTRAPLKLEPHSTPTTGTANGDFYQNTADPYKVQHRVNAEWRTVAEKKSSRTFLYPIACGRPLFNNGMTDPDWFWEVINHRWDSNNTTGVEYIAFDLNRFVPQGVTITLIRAYVNPNVARVGTNRMQIVLLSENDVGAGQTTHAYGHDDGTTSAQWLPLMPWNGQHSGGDNQSVLTDSGASWTPGELVGETVYNITDGSSGTITANTATTVTATLSGGAEADWDNGDYYQISGDIDPVTCSSDTRQYWVRIDSGNDTNVDIINSLEITYTENEYLRVP